MTYEDPDLTGTMANVDYTDAKIGTNHPSDYEAPPAFVRVTHHGWDYGFVAPVQPEAHILSDKDRTPISHVGMFSAVSGTQHPGWYLDRKK